MAKRVYLWHMRQRIMMKVTGEPSVSFPGSVDEMVVLAGRLEGLGHHVSIEGYACRPQRTNGDAVRAYARKNGFACTGIN